jgi:hypothetical protein
MGDVADIRAQIDAFQALAGANPVAVDLVRPASLDRLGLGGPENSEALATARSSQRVMRIAPDPDVAAGLLAAGYGSAHQVTARSRTAFVREMAPTLGKDVAARTYDRARLVKTRVSHLVTSLRGSIGSPHFRTLTAFNVDDEVADYFQTLSSYQTLFGSLNYCDPGDEPTILSPAAYLVDLLRVIDLAITQPNTSIPAALTLDARRPDLGAILLTNENTYTEIPYLEIVGRILAQTVGAGLAEAGTLRDDNLFLTLANLFYPFNLPYNLPLARLRAYLAAQSVSLAQVYGAFDGAQATLARYAEILHLSAEQLGNLAPPAPADLAAVVSANYGLTISAGDLAKMDQLDAFMAQTGLDLPAMGALLNQGLSAREIFDAGGSYQTTGFSTALTLVQSGEKVTGTFDQGGTINAVLIGRTVSGYWSRGADGGDVALDFADDGATFTGKTRTGYSGDWDPTPWDGTRPAESVTAGIIPRSFFINTPLPVRTYLETGQSGSGAATITMIANQSLATLDTLNRFIRLARYTGWSFAQLNWALISLNAPSVDSAGNLSCTTELGSATIVEIAKIQQLLDAGMTADVAAAMWFDLRTIGCGDGADSAAPFDMVFNTAAVLGQSSNRTIYRPRIAATATSYVNPLYTDDPLPWTVGAQADGSVASAIVAAIPCNADDLGAIAAAAFGDGTTIALTVANLSVLYRHATLAGFLNMRASAYLTLIQAQGLGDGATLPATFSRDDLLDLIATTGWVQDSGLGLANLLYVMTGVASPYATPGYQDAGIPGLLTSLAAAAKPTLIGADAFAAPGISAAESRAYFQVLINAGYLDPIGVVRKDAQASAPDLSTAPFYDPTIAVPSPTQTAAVVQLLTQASTNQLQLVAQQLATFFGSDAERLGVIVSGGAAWQAVPGPVAPFLLAPLFDVAATDVETGGVLDRAKLVAAFATQGISLSGDAVLTPSTATSWLLTAAGTSAEAISPDLASVAYYENATLLFRGMLADVETDGTLDPAKLASAFAAAGFPLPADPVVALQAAPSAFALTDPDNSATYYGMQDGAGAAFALSTAATAVATPPPAATGMVRFASQMLVLTGAMPLSNTALAMLFARPAAYGFVNVAGLVTTPREAVHAVYDFRTLIAAFHDTSNALALYLATAPQMTPDAADDALCAITSWDLDQYRFARVQMFGTVIPDTVDQVQRIARTFDLCAATGVDMYSLWAIAGTAQAPATAANFAAADTLAGALLESIRSTTPPPAWDTVYDQMIEPLLASQRDALVPIAISQLRQSFVDITTPDNLYEYLLIDVEMCGCARISVVKEALNAAQLYLQRCRLNLERNVVISTDDLPEIWWEWLLNYRVWQANREIFLYPENYIDPSLRQGKTSLFQDFENGLLQGDVTADHVDSEFRKYLNGFADLAQLEIVDACRAVVHDRDLGAVDTLFLFARTTTQPYNFYTCSRRILGDCSGPAAAEWGQWLPISISINADRVTAVYAFDRLLLFWSELTDMQQLDGTGDQNKRATVTTLSLKYSFANFSGTWVQPQTLVADLPVNVTGMNIYGPFSRQFQRSPASLWQTVGCLRIPAAAFPSGSAETEKLCLYFGPLIDQASGDGSAPPDPLHYAANPAIVTFCREIGQATLVREQLAGLGLTGQTPLFPTIVIDATLQQVPLLFENQYLILKGDTPLPDGAPAFVAGLNGTALVATSGLNTPVNNYLEGLGVSIPLVSAANTVPVTPTSFVNDYVTTTQSQNFYTALSTPPNQLIDPATGKVSVGVTTTAVPMLAALLSTSQGIARQVREVLLDAWFGSLVLLGGVSAANASLLPVGNQPGGFIVQDGQQVFLVEARPAGESEPAMIDAAIAVATTTSAVTPATLITRDIDAALASEFYTILTKAPNILIGASGVVNTSVAQQTSVQMLAAALSTDLGRAQEVRNILLSGSSPAVATYGAHGFATTDSLYTMQFSVSRLATSAIASLSAALDAGGAAALLALSQQQLPVDAGQPFSDLVPSTATIALGAATGQPVLRAPDCYFGRQVDFAGPFGQYYWELFFHAPLLVAEMLHDNQQFSDAETWLQYIFNPTLPPAPLTQTRFVALRPLDVTAAEAEAYYAILITSGTQLIDADGNVLPAALTIDPATLAGWLSVDLTTAMEIRNLLANQYLATPTARYWQFAPLRNHTLESLEDQLTNCAEIAAYNDDPFDPDAIARLRIGAYEKAVVIAYIKNLIAWGDQEFGLYSWESITTARMLYSYAGDLLGPRPVAVGECTQTPPTSFDIILARYGGDASDIPQFLIEMENALPGITTCGPMLNQAGQPFNDLGGVFAVPENDQLMGLWDLVADRVGKIRACLNIDGQPEPLALFQPPIDPMALIRAAASGNTILAVAAQARPKVPYYRFTAMLQRAVDATDRVRAFGDVLLGALQARDAEALAAMNQTHANDILQMTILLKTKAIEDLNDQIAALQQSLSSAQTRNSYYDGLISGGLNTGESVALLLMAESLDARLGVIAFNGLSIAGYLAPNIFGLADGGMKFGDAINAGAGIAGAVSEILTQSGTISSTIGEYQRRMQEWQLQSKLAGFDVAQITQDIAGATARLQAAQQDLALTQQQIRQGQQELDFLKTKFTNEDLYRWMTGRLGAVYFQAYQLALGLGLAAETAYQYELDRDDQFITFAYWDNLRQGLLAGDGLGLSLTQLQTAYVDNNPRRLEIEKTISLRQTFPLAFLGFRWGYAQGGGRIDAGPARFHASRSVVRL